MEKNPAHPLDRPAWSALSTRQARFALGDAARALRFDPDFEPFGAAAANTPENLAALGALVSKEGFLALAERAQVDLPPGFVSVMQGPLHQMVAEKLDQGPAIAGIVDLGEADAPQMRELAALTQPGPFHSRTHELGGFVGLRDNGRLIAMAGERLSLPGYTEISAVCTHPDHRGKGLAAGLMRVVGANIAKRGDAIFLHVRHGNDGAVALYRRLGFSHRADIHLNVIRRRPSDEAR